MLFKIGVLFYDYTSTIHRQHLYPTRYASDKTKRMKEEIIF